MTISETPREAIPMTRRTQWWAARIGHRGGREEGARAPFPRGQGRCAPAPLREGGGCSGYSYGLAFDDKVNEGDRVEDHAGVPVVIDQFSQQHVDGAEIDYVDSLMGSGFAINNPNAVSSCACGSSFNTDGSPAKAGGCAH